LSNKISTGNISLSQLGASIITAGTILTSNSNSNLEIDCAICKAKLSTIIYNRKIKLYTEIFLGNKSIYLCEKCTKEQLNGIIVMDEI